MYWLRLLILATLAFGMAWIGRPLPVRAQNAIADPAALKDAPVPAEVHAEAIQAKLKKVDESKDLAETLRLTLIETYKKILLQIKSRDDLVAKAATFAKAAQDAPIQLQQIKTEVQAPSEPPPTIDSELPLAQMQLALNQAEGRWTDLQKKLTDLQAEPKHRADRRVEIPKLQDAARKVLADIETLRAVKPPPDESAELTDANRTLLDVRKSASDQELNSYDQELRFYEAGTELLTARRDLAVVQTAQAEQSLKAWHAAVNDRRRTETEQQAREAHKAALQAHPAIRRLAKESADLTAVRQTLAGKIERVTHDSDACEKNLADLDAQFAKVTDRVKRVGLTQAIGLLLRKQREGLPNVELHRTDIEKRQIEISKTSLDLVDLEDQRALLADIDARTAQVLRELGDSVDETETAPIQEEIRQLLQTKRGYLDSLIADINSYLDKLVELDTRDRQLIAKANDYAAFCDEYILWIRSTDLPQTSDVQSFAQASKWLTNPSGWKGVGTALWSDAMSNPVSYLLCAGLLASLLASQQTWKRWLCEEGAQASKSFSTTFQPTVRALALTALTSITWPALGWVVGFRLNVLNGSEFMNCVGHAFRLMAPLALTMEFAKHVCSGNGLGESHFGWPHATLRSIRGILRTLMILGMPLAFIVLMLESQASENGKHSLGRGAFLVAQGLLAYSAHRVWVATQDMAQDRTRHHEWLWTNGFRRVWYICTVGAPIALATLAVLGFYYTATQLESRLIGSIWLTLALVIVHAMLIRWLLIAYRDLAIRRARERRAAEAVAATAAGNIATTGTETSIVPQPSVKLADINEQTRKLVRIAILVTWFVGMSLIWVEVLPALRVLKRVELWPRTFTILDAITKGRTPGTLTLADAIIATFTAVVTLAAARNIPGLLEITILRRLTLDSGARYAITAVSRYIITVLGMLLTFGQLGVAWSQVQWLVAAVSVGLGFGLQEIFANFVSGLILLFERPIRIGDVVTVGDVTGKVTRIRIRATTITDWDLRELVVPNKELITARVMNWTLTDTMARMTIKVGVAYGSDSNLVRRLLVEIAERNPTVLKDPAPHALFDEFGQSTMNFTLRVYLPSLDAFLQVRHDINTEICSTFKKAGIEMPFPQAEILLRSSADASMLASPQVPR